MKSWLCERSGPGRRARLGGDVFVTVVRLLSTKPSQNTIDQVQVPDIIQFRNYNFGGCHSADSSSAHELSRFERHPSESSS
jgi:hypothetical protein